MKKFILSCLVLLFFVISVDAKSAKRDLSSVINDSGINKSSVSISVKDLNTGKSVYALNENILLHPASVQKILTLLPAVEALGKDYKFTTEILSRGSDGYLIKLGADPYLTTSDLKELVSAINKEKIKTMYIDNSIIEMKDWGEGWQWDDDLNISMPRFNSYNLDNNIIQITLMPTNPSLPALVINPSKYPIAFINNVITGETNDVKISKSDETVLNVLSFSGTIKTPQIFYIPTNNLRRYFDVKLTNALEDEKIYLKNPYLITKTVSNDKLISTVNHSLSDAVKDILENSNNKVSETVIKLASAKEYNQTGTDVLGIKLFDSYCNKIGIDNSRIRIVDASGVSKNNLANTDFITEYLLKNKDNEILQQMAYPTVGTLSNRMIPLKDNLKAKTGTLSDISSIAGFLTTKKNNKYAFCIIINDPVSSNSDKKMLEDYFIREMYLHL